MALRTRIDAIGKDVEVFLTQEMGPAARSQTLARFAREQLASAKTQNERVLGRVPPYETFVDGSAGGSEDRVRPDGAIVYLFELSFEVLAFILQELQKISPVRSGRYANSHEVFADGVQIENPNNPPPAREYTIMNAQPYARKLEGAGGRPPLSPQAPDGVYQVVARRARSRFGNQARIDFSYRTALGGSVIGGRAGNRAENRAPAIIVTLR